MTGGCPARTGAAHTPGIAGPLAEAWRVELGESGSEIDDEPRVWHDRVFVATRNGAHFERSCDVIDPWSDA